MQRGEQDLDESCSPRVGIAVDLRVSGTLRHQPTTLEQANRTADQRQDAPRALGSISGTGADCVVPNEIAGECKFWLDPVSLGRNRGVPPPVVREMERLVFEHVDLLLEKYDEHHPPGNRSRSDESVD